MQDYILGGNTHYKSDRSAARDILRVFPGIRTAEKANVLYKNHALHYLASCGIRQFIDVGMGFPRSPNLHEVVHPDSSVIYIDNDPIVLLYSDDILVGSTKSVHCVLADVAEADQVIAAIDATGDMDFGQQVALCLHAVLHLISDERDPYGSVGRLIDRMAPGSYVSLTHYARDIEVESSAAVAGLCEQLDTPFYPVRWIKCCDSSGIGNRFFAVLTWHQFRVPHLWGIWHGAWGLIFPCIRGWLGKPRTAVRGGRPPARARPRHAGARRTAMWPVSRKMALRPGVGPYQPFFSPR